MPSPRPASLTRLYPSLVPSSAVHMFSVSSILFRSHSGGAHQTPSTGSRFSIASIPKLVAIVCAEIHKCAREMCLEAWARGKVAEESKGKGCRGERGEGGDRREELQERFEARMRGDEATKSHGLAAPRPSTRGAQKRAAWQGAEKSLAWQGAEKSL
eukprot:5173651-Pleurochrysis_carterae.AAC.1